MKKSLLLRAESHEEDVVGGYLCLEILVSGAEGFVCPEVVDFELAGEGAFHAVPLDFGGLGFLGCVEDADGPVSALERLDPGLVLAGDDAEAPCGDAIWVLVDGDDVLVGENVDDFGGHGANVVSCHERRGDHGPKGEVGAGLGEGEAGVSDFEHVGVVPAAGAGVLAEAVASDDGGLEGVVAVEDDFESAGPFLLAIPAVVDVAGDAPEVSDVLGPEPWLVVAPFADGESDGASGGAKGVAHGGVGFFGVAGAGGAPVVLEVVDAP